MMNFEEFQKKVVQECKDYLPEEYRDAEIRIEKINKLGGTYNGLIIRRENENAAPAIDLNALFDEYQNGEDLHHILSKTMSVVENTECKIDCTFVNDYKKVKNRLFIRVSNAEQNREMLNDIPHKVVGDLAITYHIFVQNTAEGIASATITNNLAKVYGVTTDQLHKDSLESGTKLFPENIEKLSNIIFPMQAHDENSDSNYVITNRDAVYGASTAFYPNVMNRLADNIGSDLFVIPSSIHEMICVPDDGNTDYKKLERILRDINSFMVSENERLSDNLYHYDQANGIFETCESFEKRIDKEFEEESFQMLSPADDLDLSRSGRVLH